MSGAPSSSPVRTGSIGRLFGTDGIRKVVGTEITASMVARVISAYARWVDGPGPVLIAHDFRTTSDGIARICAGTLQMNGVDVYEMGVMPTPCLQYNVRARRARGGLMVTASHNPTEFNGIKFTGPDGLELPPPAEEEIERAYEQGLGRPCDWKGAGRIRSEHGGIERYLTDLLARIDAPQVLAAAPKVVLDCGNGTSTAVAPHLLSAIGVRLKTLNANPDGGFPGRPSEPTRENLTDLRKVVINTGADVGIAFDGDSDRVAFVDERGEFLPGDVTFSLFARDVLARHPGGIVATSVTSSTAVEEVTSGMGGRLVVSPSGSLPVAEAILDHHAVFGGEENGHYYWPDHQNAPDGPMSAARLIELLARSGRPLSALVSELPRYVVLKWSVPLPPSARDHVMDGVLGTLSAEADRVVTLDGVKAFFGSDWLLVRPSGTEPICRLFTQGRTSEAATRLAERGRDLVTGLVSSFGG